MRVCIFCYIYTTCAKSPRQVPYSVHVSVHTVIKLANVWNKLLYREYRPCQAGESFENVFFSTEMIRLLSKLKIPFCVYICLVCGAFAEYARPTCIQT